MKPMINADILEGKWNQILGSVREKWGEITEDDLERIAGKRDRFLGVLQEKYGYTREKAEEELNAFLENLDENFDSLT